MATAISTCGAPGKAEVRGDDRYREHGPRDPHAAGCPARDRPDEDRGEPIAGSLPSRRPAVGTAGRRHDSPTARDGARPGRAARRVESCRAAANVTERDRCGAPAGRAAAPRRPVGPRAKHEGNLIRGDIMAKWRGWVGRTRGAAGPGRRPDRHRMPPAVLALEGRRLMTTMITVDKPGDSGPGTLRDAVARADAATAPAGSVQHWREGDRSRTHPARRRLRRRTGPRRRGGPRGHRRGVRPPKGEGPMGQGLRRPRAPPRPPALLLRGLIDFRGPDHRRTVAMGGLLEV
jgi:hypothetical protein